MEKAKCYGGIVVFLIVSVAFFIPALPCNAITVTVFYDDMEAGVANWTAQSPWALVTSTSVSPAHSWHDSPAGNYSNNINTNVALNHDISLIGFTGAALTFRTKYFTEGCCDRCYVEISTNGGVSWTSLNYFGGTQSSWTLKSYSLNSYIGNNIRIRFRLYTNSSVTYDGWYIDDVRITAEQTQSLTIQPQENFSSAGDEGGNPDPFTPSSKIYTLSNVGASLLDWTAATTPEWLDATPASGTLNPGSSTQVVISLNGTANTLPPDVYTVSGAIIFTDITNSRTETRNASLEVRRVPGEIEVIDSIDPPGDMNMPFGDVIAGLSRTGQITIANNDPTKELIVTDIALGGISASSETSDISVMLPATDGSDNSAGSYLPADWISPAQPESKLVIRGGYKMLNDGIDVLILATGSNPTILRTGLAAFPDINKIDYFNCSTGTPTLSYLSGYHVVLIMSVSSFSNSVQTGNVLADYVDAGGKVIEAVACFASGGSWELGGRFVTADYEPFVHGPGEFINHSLGNFDDTHPIMDGVTALTDALPARVVLKPQAEWVASWNNGVPLVATRNNNVAGINIFAYNEGSFTGDVVLLFHNAAVWLAGHGVAGFTMSNVPSLPVTMPPGGNFTFDVIFQPTDVRQYNSSVTIESNDRDESELEVSLSGTGIPDSLGITPDANFTFSGHPGGPFVPSFTSYSLINNGDISINWAAEPNVAWLNITPSGGILAPGSSAIVTVVPSSGANAMPEGQHTADIRFTNLTTTLPHIRKVILNVYTDPKMWTQPAAISATLMQGDLQTQSLTIGNSGDAVLTYALSSRQTGFTPPPPQQSGSSTINDVTVSAPEGHDFTVAADAPFAPDRLLVRFAPKTNGKHPDKHEKEQILAAIGGGSVKHEFKIVSGLCTVTLPQGKNIKDALKSFNSKKTEIFFAEPDYEIKLSSLKIPNDTYFNNLWGMHNTGQTGGTDDADIDAPEAWDIATGTADIIVAVIDTGVDYTHQDLTANMWVNQAEFSGTAGVDDDGNGYVDDIYGYDFYNRDGNPMDDHYHGTHVAGTIGAVGNNNLGVTGVCWNVKIMALKFLSSSGNGYDSDAISAIEYGADMGAKIASNSWGGGGYSQSLKDTINAAGAAGMLFVAAAGNDYGNNNDTYPVYPASYDCANIIAVLSTDYYDAISGFSNYGPTTVDLGAPGSSIYSCVPGNQYTYLSGTSMATPHVSGACALVWSTCPSLHYSIIKDIILQTVDPQPALNGMCVSGGRLNLYNAVKEAGAQWIQFEPSSGSVAPAESRDAAITFDAERAAGTYQGEIIISSNDPYTPEAIIPVTMVVEPADYLTELFDANDPNQNDLAYRTLVFSPRANGHYAVCVEQAADFPVDPAGGTIVTLRDDDYVPVTLQNASIVFCGNNYDTFYIGSNGYITFDSGDIRLLETLEDHFDLPRISALFDDLDPSAGGIISWKHLNDRIAVTFEDISEYNSAGTNSFQIEMFFNGKIRITFLDIAAEDGLAGLSNGLGLSLYFTKTDFSSKSPCNFQADFTGDLGTDFFDFAIFTECEQAQYGNISQETVLDQFNTVSYSGNDGTSDWIGPWQESGEADGPAAGIMQVISRHNAGYLSFNPPNKGTQAAYSLVRDANLAGALTAALTFDYETENKTGETIVLISPDGGATWQTLATYDQTSGVGSVAFDITPYAGVNTLLKFELVLGSAMYAHFDNIQIEYDLLRLVPPCVECNLDRQGMIDLSDLAIFADHWLE